MGIELKRKPTVEEVEGICVAAEESARRHVLSKVPWKTVSDLDVVVEAEGDKPLTITVQVSVELSGDTGDLQALVTEATRLAFSAAEAKARELDLCFDIQN